MQNLQTFAPNTPVLNQEGEKVGSIERVVISPDDHQVTHLVVRKGLFFTTDKVIPVEFVQSANDEAITLRSIEDLDKMPDFQDTYYISADDGAPLRDSNNPDSLYWYPPYVTNVGTFGYAPLFGHPTPPDVQVTERNIPDHTVALQDSTDVYSADDEKIGSIEEILADQEGKATHFVIGKGFIFKERRLVPASWIKSISDKTVILSVSQAVFKNLPEYEPTNE